MERRECRKLTFFISLSANFLVEETDDLAGNVLSSGLLVVHDTSRGGEDDIAELTGRQQLDDPLLEVGQADVVAGRDDTSLVETAVQLDDDLAGAVVIDLLELANVAVALHDLEELDNDLGARSDQDLTLAGLLGVVDAVEGIVENGSADHLGGIDEKEILKSELEMRYLPQGKHMLDSEWPRSVESALSDPSTRVQPAHCRRGSSVSRNASQSRCVPNRIPHDVI